MTATLTEARNNLSLLWDKATQDREVIILQRRGAEDVALIAVSELDGLLEPRTYSAPPPTRNVC